MKRILSILMSMALIATLLISMSVTSNAVVYVEPETPITFSLEIEEVDDGTVFDDIIYASDSCYEAGIETFEGYATAKGYTVGENCYIYKAKFTFNNSGVSVSKNGTLYSGWFLFDALINFTLDEIVYDDEYSIAFVVDDSAHVSARTNQNGIVPNVNSAPSYNDGLVIKELNDSDISKMGTISRLYPYKASPSGDSADPMWECYFLTTTKDFDVTIDSAGLRLIEVIDQPNTMQYMCDDNDSNNVISVDTDGDLALVNPTDASTNTWSFVDGELQAGGSSEPTMYTVTFKNGDSVLQSTEVAENTAVTAPEAPTAPVDADPAYNYTFAGWSDGSDTYPSNEIPVATDNVEYTAVFHSEKKTVTATFVVEGKANVTKTVEYGETPTADGVDTTVEGKNFTGWLPELGPITTDTIYTAQLVDKAPTTYTITFVVDGQADVVLTVDEGTKPAFTGTPSKDGHTFEGWEAEDGTVYTGELPVATANATYEAVFAPIPAVDSKVTITAVDRITGDIFPISGKGTAEVTTLSGKKETIEAARLHRVHTTFTYEPGDYPLVEMGMLFVPKVVVDEAGIAKDAEEIANAGIAKDANCKNLPGEITGGVANFIFKAGLVDVPTTIEGKSTKGIIIYAIPYYTLSGGARQYHGVIETTF